MDSRSSSVLEKKQLKSILAPILPQRRSSAKANLQTHPCFQSSLFDDKERAAGSFKEWKERQKNFDSKKDLNKDYELKHIIWAESVMNYIFFSFFNLNNQISWFFSIVYNNLMYILF